MHAIFEHTADLGIRVEAPSLEQAFAEAGRGLFTVIAGDLGQIRTTTVESFEVAGTDLTWLLFDWAGELHAAFELRRMLFADFAVAIGAAGLRATARGERYDPGRHRADANQNLDTATCRLQAEVRGCSRAAVHDGAEYTRRRRDGSAPQHNPAHAVVITAALHIWTLRSYRTGRRPQIAALLRQRHCGLAACCVNQAG